MNREIKFRAWDSISEIMHNWKIINDTHLPLNDFIKLDHYHLMQYTGLKDKNGVEIYEGDIVEYDNGTKANVIFKEGCFCGYDGYAVSSDEAYTLLSLEDVPFNGGFEIEVIGNIHETKTLSTQP